MSSGGTWAGDLTVVVTGASGRTGRRVAEAARDAGLAVRHASRAHGFDWDAPQTWAAALRGADAAHLVHPADVGAPAATEAVGRLAREAVALGVRRLVLLSARGEEQALSTEAAPARVGRGLDGRPGGVVRAELQRGAAGGGAAGERGTGVPGG
jgi:uncharacterized protein YbjT (DUF2867 family)